VPKALKQLHILRFLELNARTKKEAAGNRHQFSSALFQKPIIKKSKSRERSSYHLAEIKKKIYRTSGNARK